MDRKPICNLSDIPANGIRRFEIAPGKSVCIVNAVDTVFACQAVCPHEGIPLCDGVFDGEVLTCLEHLWQWDLRKGGQACGLAESALQMFTVEMEGQEIYLANMP